MTKLYKDQNRILVQCKQAIQKIVPDTTVILYGSYASGESRPDSDIDLLVLVAGDVEYNLTQKIRHRLFDIELKEEERGLIRYRLIRGGLYE